MFRINKDLLLFVFVAFTFLATSVGYPVTNPLFQTQIPRTQQLAQLSLPDIIPIKIVVPRPNANASFFPLPWPFSNSCTVQMYTNNANGMAIDFAANVIPQAQAILSAALTAKGFSPVILSAAPPIIHPINPNPGGNYPWTELNGPTINYGPNNEYNCPVVFEYNLVTLGTSNFAADTKWTIEQYAPNFDTDDGIVILLFSNIDHITQLGGNVYSSLLPGVTNPSSPYEVAIAFPNGKLIENNVTVPKGFIMTSAFDWDGSTSGYPSILWARSIAMMIARLMGVGHSDTPGNLMNPNDPGGTSFTRLQAAKFTAAINQDPYLREKNIGNPTPTVKPGIPTPIIEREDLNTLECGDGFLDDRTLPSGRRERAEINFRTRQNWNNNALNLESARPRTANAKYLPSGPDTSFARGPYTNDPRAVDRPDPEDFEIEANPPSYYPFFPEDSNAYLVWPQVCIPGDVASCLPEGNWPPSTLTHFNPGAPPGTIGQGSLCNPLGFDESTLSQWDNAPAIPAFYWGKCPDGAGGQQLGWLAWNGFCTFGTPNTPPPPPGGGGGGGGGGRDYKSN